MEAAEIASLRRRWLASLIDGGAVVAPVVLATGGGVWLYMRYDRQFAAFRRFGESRQWAFALQAASLPIEIRLRNWRSPGMRAMGIHRADARNGGPVTVRSVVVREAVVTTWREVVRRALRPSEERFRERRRLIEEDLEEIRRRHADDRDARDRAMQEVLKRYGVRPWATLSRGLLGFLPPYLPALWSERNQSLPDRLAGIIVVRD